MDTTYANAWEIELPMTRADRFPPKTEFPLLHDDQSVYCLPDEAERGQGVGAEEDRNLYKAGTAKIPGSTGVSSHLLSSVDGVYPSLYEVPTDVSLLSVEDVVQCLVWLNLQKYVDKFRAELIDGALLTSLDQRVLMEDFGFRRIEAIRLERFARHGWKPILDRPSLNQQKHLQLQQQMHLLYLQPEPLYTDV